MTDKDKATWIELIRVLKNFLENKKYPDFIKHIEQFMLHFQRLGRNMRITRKFRRLKQKTRRTFLSGY